LFVTQFAIDRGRVAGLSNRNIVLALRESNLGEGSERGGQLRIPLFGLQDRDQGFVDFLRLAGRSLCMQRARFL
jgi:hypothetical protein